MHALISVFNEEASFIHAVFGNTDGPATIDDFIEIDRRSSSKACLRGVMEHGALTQFMEDTQALFSKIAFTTKEYQTVVDVSQSYFSCLAELSSESGWSVSRNSTSTSGVGDRASHLNKDSMVARDDYNGAGVALAVSSKVFQNIENGTLTELCHLVASAEMAAQNGALNVRGFHIDPAMKLMKEALTKVSSRKLLLQIFGLLQLPSFLRIGADLFRAIDVSGESPINPAFKISLRFATVDVRLSAVETLLQEVATATHKYELGVCQALIKASVSFRNVDPSLFTLSNSKAAALQQMMAVISIMKRSPLVSYKSRRDYISAASAILTGANVAGASSFSPTIPTTFSASRLKAEIASLQSKSVPSLAQVSALTISLNNLNFLKREISCVDDDGTLQSLISMHLEGAVQAFVGEMMAVFDKHTILPLPNVL